MQTTTARESTLPCSRWDTRSRRRGTTIACHRGRSPWGIACKTTSPPARMYPARTGDTSMRLSPQSPRSPSPGDTACTRTRPRPFRRSRRSTLCKRLRYRPPFPPSRTHEGRSCRRKQSRSLPSMSPAGTTDSSIGPRQECTGPGGKARVRPSPQSGKTSQRGTQSATTSQRHRTSQQDKWSNS